MKLRAGCMCLIHYYTWKIHDHTKVNLKIHGTASNEFQGPSQFHGHNNWGMIPSMSVIKNVYFQILYLNMIRFSIILSCDRQVVLLQEVERWNRLVERMADSLFQLRRALAGKLGIYCLKVLIICKHIMNEVCQLIGLKCNWFLSKLPRAAPFV